MDVEVAPTANAKFALQITSTYNIHYILNFCTKMNTLISLRNVLCLLTLLVSVVHSLNNGLGATPEVSTFCLVFIVPHQLSSIVQRFTTHD